MDAGTSPRLHGFHGGLRLSGHKDESLGRPPGVCPTPPRLRVPLLQHQGEPARALVEPGEVVARGQLIGRPQGGVTGALVHAPAGGRVVAVAPREVIGVPRQELPCVEIDTDPEAPDAFLPPLADWRERDAHDLLERIRAAGIVGLGGAVFPTHLKAPHAGDPALERLVINGAECEPWISCDQALLRQQARRVVAGARMAARALGAARIEIAVEDSMPRVLEPLATALREAGDDTLRVVQVPSLYPEGSERQLVEVLTGREVPAGGIPLELGLACLNVGTVAAVHDAVAAGRPLISRMVTVTGPGIVAPGNWETPIGTPVSWLVRQAGGYAEGVRRLLMGGNMMGVPLPHDDLPVTKASNCLLALTEATLADPAPEMPCIRCMACVPVCPARLLPQQLHWHIRGGNWDELAAHGLADCIECGCCAVVCPSHIPLVDYYRFGKSELRAQAVEQRRSEEARRRHEARQERLERLAAEREARLEARRARLRERDRRSEIEAAVERARERRAEAREGGDDAL